MSAEKAIRLTPAEFTACWDVLDLGDTPVQLTHCGPGNGIDAQARLRAMASLTARGYLDGRSVNGALAEMLHLLADHDYSLDVTAGSARGRLIGLGAVSQERGVAVATGGDDLNLVARDSSRIAATLLGLFGTVKPGVGRPTNIPAALLDDALSRVSGTDLWAVADCLVAEGVPRIDASSVVRMTEGMWCRGQLGATVRFDGPEQRAPWVIGVHATPLGWFMQLRRDGTVTLCPTDTTRLLQQWRQLLEHLTLVSR